MQRGLIVEPAQQRQQHDQEFVSQVGAKRSQEFCADRPIRAVRYVSLDECRHRPDGFGERLLDGRSRLAQQSSRKPGDGVRLLALVFQPSVVGRIGVPEVCVQRHDRVAQSGRVGTIPQDRFAAGEPLDPDRCALDEALLGEAVGVEVVGQAIDLAGDEVDERRAARNAVVVRHVAHHRAVMAGEAHRLSFGETVSCGFCGMQLDIVAVLRAPGDGQRFDAGVVTRDIRQRFLAGTAAPADQAERAGFELFLELGEETVGWPYQRRQVRIAVTQLGENVRRRLVSGRFGIAAIALPLHAEAGFLAKQGVRDRRAVDVFHPAVQIEIPRHADHVIENLRGIDVGRVRRDSERRCVRRHPDRDR